MAEKTQLTFEEKIRVAFAHFILGIEMQHIAFMMGVNIGRISEACSTAEAAFDRDKPPRLKREKKNGDEQTPLALVSGPAAGPAA
jgi:hypothetical protein